MFQDQWDYFWVDSRQYYNDAKWQQQAKKDFSPIRWQDFSKDFLHLQRGSFAGISERVWNDILWDHGFNGTPAWVFSVHWFVESFPVEKLKLLCYADCIWLLAALSAVIWAYGFTPACFLLIFLFTSYSMRWPTDSAALPVKCFATIRCTFSSLATEYSVAFASIESLQTPGETLKTER